MPKPWLMQYFSDTEYLTFLEQKITRLRTLIERQEKLGVQISSVGGNYKSFVNLELLNKQFSEAISEYDAVYNRIHHGRTTNRQVKFVVFKG
jgi:hypothetical protein